MKEKSHWWPIDNESNWMLVGSVFGLVIMPMVMFLFILGLIIYLVKVFL